MIECQDRRCGSTQEVKSGRKKYICEYALDFIVGLRLTKTNKQEKENKINNFAPNLNFEL